jgi:hypothetical protein
MLCGWESPMPAAAKPKKTDALPETFEALKKIYKAFAKSMNVTIDDGEHYYLESRAPMFRGRTMCFGFVRMGKGRVSFHLMALYCFPEMKKKISPELKKRMQGKQCFNFAKPDATLFAELSRLAAEGASRFAAIKDFEAHIKGQHCED